MVYHKNNEVVVKINHRAPTCCIRENCKPAAQANENLKGNVLKNILTPNKVKEQICMHKV